MNITFDGVVTPLKIDICAYNLETVLAEKLETIITRATQ